MSEFDVYYKYAQDRNHRINYFKHSRVMDLISILSRDDIEYVARIILKFTTKNKFDLNFETYQQGEYARANYDSRIFEIGAKLYAIYSEGNQGKLNLLRSVILERLIYELRKKHYSMKSESWIEPYVILSTKTYISSKSLDIAAWHQRNKRGECYECSVSADFVTEDVKKQEIRSLQNIYSEFKGKIKVYFASFANTLALENKVGKFSDVELIGRDRFHFLLN